MRLLLVAMLLAGCAGKPDTVREACERQALDAPEVKSLLMRAAGNVHFKLTHMDEIAVAKQDATVACLQSRGVIRPGGVERQKPLH